MIKGQSATVTYTAWDSGTGTVKTLDASNHTVYFSKDGGTFAQTTGTPSELGNGVYKVTLTAAETNCSLGTLAPTSSTSGVVIPPVAVVFHDFSSLASSSAVSTLQTSVNAIPTTTYNVPTVAQIQNGLATSSAVSALQTSVSAIPTTTYNVPTVAQIQSGLASSSAVSTLQTSVNAIPTTTYTIPTVEQIQNGLATSSAVSALQTSVSAIPTTTYNVPTVAQIQNGLATSSAVAALSTVLAKVFALVGKWTVTGNTLTAYDSSGNVIYTGTLTRNTSDQIIAVTETTENTVT